MINHKKVWIGIAVVAVVASAVWKYKNRKNNQPQFQQVLAEKGDLQVSILATGVVQPQNRVEIKPPIAGRAEEILVQEGQAVKKGQVVAYMSSAERAALLDAARAKGPQELAHWEDLYKPAPLVAPLSGLVIARNVEPGQTITAQDPVLVMSNRLIVKAQVDETDIGKIKIGQTAEVTLDAFPQEKILSHVDHIAYEAKTVNNVTVYEVDIVPNLVPLFMRSGMTANVNFLVASKKDVVLVPTEAVRQENGWATVLVPSPEGKGRPQAQEVQLGLSDGKKTEIVSGLEPGGSVLIRVSQLSRQNSRRSSPLSPMGGSSRRQRQ